MGSKTRVQMKLSAEQKQSYRCGGLIYGCQGVRGREINWKIETDVCILPYIRQMTNRDPLNSAGNCTQYSVMAYMGKESKKQWVYVCVWLIHFAEHLKLTQHCKPIIPQFKEILIKNFKKANPHHHHQKSKRKIEDRESSGLPLSRAQTPRQARLRKKEKMKQVTGSGTQEKVTDSEQLG